MPKPSLVRSRCLALVALLLAGAATGSGADAQGFPRFGDRLALPAGPAPGHFAAPAAPEAGLAVRGERRAAAQAATLSGTVRDARTMRPLTTVQVYLPALNRGTLTDADGRYVLTDVPAGSQQLRVQLIGYGEQTRAVEVAGNQSLVVDFLLEQTALALDEIIVTGTPGGTEKRALGNVVEQVELDVVAEVAPVVTMQQALTARVPGLVMGPSSSSNPGEDGATIRLRGSSSPFTGNSPVIYVDGIRLHSDLNGGVSRLNDINPNDIESIEVIKGPAAATLYGTEASGGVIQIITKRGATGRPRFDVSMDFGVSKFPDPGKNIWTRYQRHPDGRIISMHHPTMEVEQGFPPLFRLGMLQQYNLAMTGGTDVIRYFASGALLDREGTYDWTWENRYQGRMQLSITPSDKLTFDIGAHTSRHNIRLTGGSPLVAMFRGSALNCLPCGGTIEHRNRGWAGPGPPEAFRDGREELQHADRTTFSVTANYAPVPWFRSRLVAGRDLTVEQEELTIFRDSLGTAGFWGADALGRRDVGTTTTQLNSLDFSGTITRPLFAGLTSASSFGLQYIQKEIGLHSSRGDVFASRTLTTVGAAATTQANETFEEAISLGVFVQQQVDFANRIFLTGAVRLDDHSAFGSEFDAPIYPKLSAAWVLSDEPWYRWNSLVDAVRLRSAWGAAGRQPNTFASKTFFSVETGPGDAPILTPQTTGNPDLGPERSEELEVGFDLSTLGNRLEVGYTRYWRKTKDAIVTVPLAPSFGMPEGQQRNIGQVRNWGSELSLDLQAINRRALRWNVLAAWATHENVIDDLGPNDFIVISRGQVHATGYPLASHLEQWIVSAEFVNGTQGRVTNLMCDGGTGPTGRDRGGPIVPCGQAPRLYWGRPAEPTWTVNLASTLTLFDRVELFGNVEGKGGHQVYADGMAGMNTTYASSLESIEQTDPIFMAYVQTRREATAIFDAGHVRLREVALRYSLPEGWAARMGARAASINLAARNVALLWREDEYLPRTPSLYIPDPDVSRAGDSFSGEVFIPEPQSKQLQMTVRMSF